MGWVMIKCPTTGKNVWAGVFTDSQEELDASDIVDAPYGYCPVCEGSHTWSSKDAFYSDELLPP
jgi:hypothetical protein